MHATTKPYPCCVQYRVHDKTAPYHLTTAPYHLTTAPYHLTTAPYHLTTALLHLTTLPLHLTTLSLYLTTLPLHLTTAEYRYTLLADFRITPVKSGFYTVRFTLRLRTNFSRQPLRTFHCLYHMQGWGMQVYCVGIRLVYLVYTQTNKQQQLNPLYKLHYTGTQFLICYTVTIFVIMTCY